jgi:hypothetical protein
MIEHQFLYKNLNCDPEAHHIRSLSDLDARQKQTLK